MKKLQIILAVSIFSAISMPIFSASSAFAEVVVVGKKCKKGVCGKATYDGSRVYIRLYHKLSRFTHFNFKTNPGAQIEVANGYSFDRGPGEHGTYSVQACNRGGIGSRSTCTKWATFKWSTGEDEMDEE